MNVELRCDSRIAGADELLRCQLLAGHEDGHVSVTGGPGGLREIWRWKTNADLRRGRFRSDLAAGRPWAPGMPRAEILQTRTEAAI